MASAAIVLGTGCPEFTAVEPEASTGSSGAASSESGADAAVCGNGVVEPGESCDDGNRVEGDGCSPACETEVCTNGVRDEAESDVDCGGPCPACAAGATCTETADCAADLACHPSTQTCRLPPNCAGILARDPAATSGEFDIDPAGNGEILGVRCDMDGPLGGGWTLVYGETFDLGTADPAWSMDTVTNCGQHIGVLGGAEVLDGQVTVTRSVALQGVPHQEARLRVDFLYIDSWDAGEAVTGTMDGATVFTVPLQGNLPSNPMECGSPLYTDGAEVLDGAVPHEAGSTAIALRTNLDSGAFDESWGLDAVQVWVR